MVNSKIALPSSTEKTERNVFFPKVPKHSLALLFLRIWLIGPPSESFAVKIGSELVSKARLVLKDHGGGMHGFDNRGASPP